jgi:NAD(P)-dependent dehydrogenase (short-subunit alcohol dehydrogenase family)
MSNRKATIVMTGVSRGLGQAMAKGFAARGHTVLGCARDGTRVRDLAAGLGQPHAFTVVDVTDDAAVADWAARVLADHGAPDFLINNAAVINANAPLWQVPAADFDRVIDVNLKGIANTIRHFLPAMIERGSGVVVNFSSGWGRSTSPEVAPYCATKWGVEGLTQALAQELPRGLAAVPLNPGVINTEMLQSCFGDGAAAHPSPEEWAGRAVPFILGLGPKANGQPLSVA